MLLLPQPTIVCVCVSIILSAAILSFCVLKRRLGDVIYLFPLFFDLNHRDFCILTCWGELPDGSAYVVNRSVEHPLCPPVAVRDCLSDVELALAS